MKVTTEELEQCTVLLTIELEPRKEKDILAKAAKRIAREVRIPGFRPGKAPYNVVVRRFGLDVVQQEALEHSADKIIQDALTEAEVEPFARINLESINWDPLTIKVKVPTEPKVELADYQNIRLDYEPVEITDEDVEEQLDDLQERYATWVPVERAAEIGDMVTMSVISKDGDEVIEEDESTEYVLDPPEAHEGHVHPDLTTPLIGVTAGEERTFSLTYPEEYNNEQYAGKEITLVVNVSSVKEKELDPLDDEFAKSVSDFETLDELKEDLRKNLADRRQRELDNELGNEMLDQLMEESTIEWAQAFEDESVQDELDSFERQVKAYGLTLDTYLQMQNKTADEYSDEIREQIVDRLKRTLVLSEIATKENIDVSEAEVLERAKLIADMSGGDDQIWRNILASPTQHAMISNEISSNKAIKWLAAIARGENPAAQVEAESEDVADDGQDQAAESEEATPQAVLAGSEQIEADIADEAETTEANS